MSTPNMYVDSNAVGLNDGTLWKDAYTSLGTALNNIAAGGELIWVANNHSEDVGVTYLPPVGGGFPTSGTGYNPVKIVSVDPATDLLSAGAYLDTDTHIRLGGNVENPGLLFHGFTFEPSKAAASDDFVSIEADSAIYLVDCTIIRPATATQADAFVLNSGSDGIFVSENLTIDLRSTSVAGPLRSYDVGNTRMRGITFTKSGAGVDPDDLLYQLSAYNKGVYENLDLSAFASLDFSSQSIGWTVGHPIKLLNSKLPATFSGTSPTFYGTGRFEILNCVDGSGHLHGVIVESGMGTIVDNATNYLRGDVNGTGFSLQFDTKVDGLADVNLVQPLWFLIAEFWADANPTITVNFATATGDTLDSSEAWIEIDHPTAGSPQLGKTVSTRSDKWLETGTPAALTTNSEAWTGSGFGTKYEIEHTITGGAAGPHRVYFNLATDGVEKTVYVDPEPEIS